MFNSRWQGTKGPREFCSVPRYSREVGGKLIRGFSTLSAARSRPVPLAFCVLLATPSPVPSTGGWSASPYTARQSQAKPQPKRPEEQDQEQEISSQLAINFDYCSTVPRRSHPSVNTCQPIENVQNFNLPWRGRRPNRIQPHPKAKRCPRRWGRISTIVVAVFPYGVKQSRSVRLEAITEGLGAHQIHR